MDSCILGISELGFFMFVIDRILDRSYIKKNDDYETDFDQFLAAVLRK